MDIISEIGIAIPREFTANLNVSTKTLILAGSSIGTKGSIRPLLRKELGEYRYIQGFDVLYPEEIFNELLSRKTGTDLLKLENMLAESAHAVIIIAESYGAIAELGAFVNSNTLRPKVVAILDKKYRNDKGFIMLGPIAQLRNTRKEAVIFHDFKSPHPAKLAEITRRTIRAIIKDTSIDDSLSNPIRAQYFFLASIFIAEPISLNLLIKFLIATNECDSSDVSVVASTSLNILLRQKDISMDMSGEYYITPSGLRRLSSIIKNTKRAGQIIKLFDKYRVDILNATLRKSKRRHSPIMAKGVLP
ncbi:retron St85 family effector protein [Chloroflexota bacterium]